MAQGVCTRRRRITFVEKDASECGDGTKYPMLATPAQIAEIMYRVKDAWFTSGDILWDYGGGSTTNISAIGGLTVGDPFVKTLAGSVSYVERSYALQRVSTWDNESHYFESGYSNPAAVNVGTYDTAFDVGDRERALFFPDKESITDFPFNGINTQCPIVLDTTPSNFVFAGSSYEEYTFRCGFNHLLLNEGLIYPDPYGIVGYPDGDPAQAGDTFTSLVFSGEIAWVDVNGSGNPLDPLNELYIGLSFGIELSGITLISTQDNLTGTLDPLGCNFVIGLADGVTLSCPLYFDSAITGSPTTVSDFVITAQEGFPYAAGVPATPVWNTATGAKL